MNLQRILLGFLLGLVAGIGPWAKPVWAAYFRQPSYPDIFLFGAPKCGTTATFGVLVNHAAICSPTAKEPSFFGGPLFEKGEDYYRAFFNGTQRKPCHLTIDSTPYFGFVKDAMANMTTAYEPADLRSKKFIITLRHPAKRFFSWYDMIVRQATVRVKEIIAAGKPEILVDHLGVKYLGYPLSKLCTIVELNFGCRDISVNSRYIQHPEMMFQTFEKFYNSMFAKPLKPMTYKTQLLQLWSLVPRVNTFIVNFDTITANSAAVFAGIAGFLNIPNEWHLEYLKEAGASQHSNRTMDCETFDHLDAFFKVENEGLVDMINADGKNPFQPYFPPFSESSRKSCV